MRSLLISLGIASSLFSGVLSESKAAINAFKRAEKFKPAIRERELHEFEQPKRLDKRASPYLTEATQKFVVNGSGIPDVDFDVGESYAGLLPISAAADETRELFFWFFPSTNPLATDEVTIWFVFGACKF
ncbi:MAG: hypothetical protein L6R37_005328 [Teloschistes peruensis]|nr:MAG: hypothetical protein L6R37_005328 [Teloschistes peruensis]